MATLHLLVGRGRACQSVLDELDRKLTTLRLSESEASHVARTVGEHIETIYRRAEALAEAGSILRLTTTIEGVEIDADFTPRKPSLIARILGLRPINER